MGFSNVFSPKIFLLALVIVCCFASFSTADAARNSTVEELKYALQCSVSSLCKTDSYRAFIKNADCSLDDVMTQLKICSVEASILNDIRGRKVVGGQEAATCLAHACLIVELRRQSLELLVKALTCDTADFEVYRDDFVETVKKADKWRLQFREKYGY